MYSIQYRDTVTLFPYSTAFEDPNMDLFEWSILQNRKELAFVFLQECRVCLSEMCHVELILNFAEFHYFLHCLLKSQYELECSTHVQSSYRNLNTLHLATVSICTSTLAYYLFYPNSK